jgi:hypothetical protein
MMEAARTSETLVDNYFTRQYIPEDNSEPHTRRRENLKSHISIFCFPTLRLARYLSGYWVLFLAHVQNERERARALCREAQLLPQ